MAQCAAGAAYARQIDYLYNEQFGEDVTQDANKHPEGVLDLVNPLVGMIDAVEADVMAEVGKVPMGDPYERFRAAAAMKEDRERAAVLQVQKEHAVAVHMRRTALPALAATLHQPCELDVREGPQKEKQRVGDVRARSRLAGWARELARHEEEDSGRSGAVGLIDLLQSDQLAFSVVWQDGSGSGQPSLSFSSRTAGLVDRVSCTAGGGKSIRISSSLLPDADVQDALDSCMQIRGGEPGLSVHAIIRSVLWPRLKAQRRR